MTDKPKRKRSEKAKLHSRRRLNWTGVLYSLLLIPQLFTIGSVLFTLFSILLTGIILLIGSYFVTSLGRFRENVLTRLAMIVVETATVCLAWICLTIPAFAGFTLYVHNLLSSYSLSLFALGVAALLGVLVFVLCFVFTFEIQFRIIDFMTSNPETDFDTEKQKNIATDNVETEPDIPLELLTESESAEQAQR